MNQLNGASLNNYLIGGGLMVQHTIEPAARIITAIGRDLIKDLPASIVELVKNSYDADASYVEIILSKIDNKLHIKISDDGHGMDEQTIIGTWLVPGTDHKFRLKRSPKKRPFQGRKGIGRYAAAVLGNELELESVHDGKKTIAYIDWKEFERKKYLRDVKISVTSEETNSTNGTTLNISGGQEYIELLTDKEIKNILKELRKLVSPLDSKIDDSFSISVEFVDFYEEEFKNEKIIIEPFPILEFYNYRLTGTISSDGQANLKFENAYKSPPEVIDINKKFILEEEDESYCGNIKVDFKVFDKDEEGIDLIVTKLQNHTDEQIGKRFVKRTIKESTGVGIYRNGFRIRPHGDPGFDWLNLDNRRVQNPSMRIGSDSVAGFIDIEPEEFSYLEEKSARDGLKESSFYNGLISLIKQAITLLENRRFEYRQLKLKQARAKTPSGSVQGLFDFSEFQTDIQSSIDDSLNKIKKDPLKIEQYTDQMKKDVEQKIQTLEKQKNIEYEHIKEIIAIYQGQVTLGKIISVILHEGRKSIGYFSNQLPRTIKWLNKLGTEEKLTELPLFQRINDRLQTTEKESKSLTRLFKKLDPLTITRRTKPKSIDLKEIIKHVYEIFESELKYSNIRFETNVDGDTVVYGTEEDFLMCVTNLLENSIYWLKKGKKSDKCITINLLESEDSNIIEIIDNGPGIEKEFIESESIFVPGFSGKSEDSGTGLGLAIAGEAINRNNGELKAIYLENGAYFIIEIGKNLGEA
ncbi:sensor histidine kinase [Bacillus thuringiensis]|uniref:sensor histidine kinase n=2 Tax=Bacillus thuringiensis TaxID=1428 RepID=UPI000E5106F4|nr:sensor histidine kinase [Bacillus thuringiensis]